MKKLFFILVILLLLVSCVPSVDWENCEEVYDYELNEEDEMIYGANMKNAYEDTVSYEDLEVIFGKDSIPSNFSKWHKNNIVDYETNRRYVEYTYIKSLGKSQEIYRAENIYGTKYRITKRIVIK